MTAHIIGHAEYIMIGIGSSTDASLRFDQQKRDAQIRQGFGSVHAARPSPIMTTSGFLVAAAQTELITKGAAAQAQQQAPAGEVHCVIG